MGKEVVLLGEKTWNVPVWSKIGDPVFEMVAERWFQFGQVVGCRASRLINEQLLRGASRSLRGEVVDEERESWLRTFEIQVLPGATRQSGETWVARECGGRALC